MLYSLPSHHHMTWRTIIKSSITLWPLTCDVNDTDHLFITALVSGWDIFGSKWTFFLNVGVLEAGKMGKCKDTTEFDNSQTVMSGRLGQTKSSSSTAALLGCSRSAVVSVYQSVPGKEQWWRLARVVWSNRRAVAQTTEKVNAGSHRKLQNTQFVVYGAV